MGRIFGAPILTKRKISIFRCLSPKGEFLKMSEASPRWVKNTEPESGKGNFSGRTKYSFLRIYNTFLRKSSFFSKFSIY